MLAACKLRAVPINVNHRYVADELRYLLDNSDAVGVVTQPSLAATVAAVVPDVPAVGFTLVTGDDYEGALAAASGERPVVPGRGDDDHYVIYTGGTTGMPKGVVWRHEDAFYSCIGGGDPMRMHGPVERPDELPDRIVDSQVCYLPVAPLMHAAAQWTSFSWLFAGGKVVLMPGSLDGDAVWRAIAAEKVNLITVVGDAVARPVLDAWDRAVERDEPYDASSLFSFSNGGAPMSPATRERIFATLPHLMVTDGFGSSEAGTQGAMRVAAGEGAAAAGSAGGAAPALVRFDQPTKPTIVVDAADPRGPEVAPGSGVAGQVLAGGRLPARLPQRPREDRGHLRRARRRALARHRRHGDGRRRRHHRAAGPRLGLHQHRRREGLPRGGRERAQGPPGGVRLPGRGRARRAVGQRGHRRRAAGPRRPSPPSPTWPPTARRRWPATRPRSTSSWSTPSSARRRARPTTAGPRRRPRSRCPLRAGRRAPATRRCGGPGTAPRWPAGASRAPCRAPGGSSPGWG